MMHKLLTTFDQNYLRIRTAKSRIYSDLLVKNGSTEIQKCESSFMVTKPAFRKYFHISQKKPK